MFVVFFLFHFFCALTRPCKARRLDARTLNDLGVTFTGMDRPRRQAIIASSNRPRGHRSTSRDLEQRLAFSAITVEVNVDVRQNDDVLLAFVQALLGVGLRDHRGDRRDLARPAVVDVVVRSGVLVRH